MAQIRTQRKLIISGLACAGATALLSACFIPIVKLAVSAVQHGNVRLMSVLGLAVVALYGVKYWFTRGEVYFLSDACARLTTQLRVQLFGKLQKLPISYYNESRTGIIQSVLTADVGLYTNAVNILRDSIDGPIRAIGAFFWIVYIQWQLAAISLVFLPIMATVIYKNGKRIKSVQGDVQRDYAELQAMTQEALYGVRIVKAFSAEERVTNSFGRLAHISYASQMRATKTVATLRPLVELIGATGIAAALVMCGMLAHSSPDVVSNVAAVLMGFDVVNGGVRTLGYVNSSYNQVQAAADRIYSMILDQPEEIEDNPGAMVPEKVCGKIEFRNVSFTYPDGTVALRNVSFTIEPGTSLALVGSSGAGKSTIADLLLRFYEPTCGEILLDGVNITDLKLSWYRALIGVVPQHTFLFAGSIADNIRLGDEDAGLPEIEAAGEAAHASAFVKSMPNAYEARIGEGGVGLSGGEKQRIAIARAVVRRPKLLILDEATSNLDAVSEKHVQAALDEIMKTRTTLFIAHRLTSAARADRILMLSHGECVETGTHQQLMKQNGAYAAMYRAFSSGLLDEPLE